MSVEKDVKQVGKALVLGQAAGGVAGLIGLVLGGPIVGGLAYLGVALYASHQKSNEDTEPQVFHMQLTETSSPPRRK